MKKLFQNPRRLGLLLALAGVALSAFAMTREPPRTAPRYFGAEFAAEQRALAAQPAAEAPATF